MSEPPLKTVYWYVTSACNQHCKHCWISAGAARGPELTEGQLVEVFEKMVDMGLGHVKVTGGEPFLRWKKIRKVLQVLTDCSIKMRIETNGTLLCTEHRDEILTFLKSEQILRVALSLDSHIPAQHDYFREMEGAFEKTMQALALLKENGIPFSIITVLHRQNCQHIEDIIDFVGTFEPSNHLIDLIMPEGRSKVNVEYQLPPAFYIEKLPSLIRKVKKEKGRKVVFNYPFVFSPLEVDFVSCTVGKELCGLLPNGDIAVCGAGINNGELALGNALRGDIEDIWENSPAFLTLRKSAFDIEGICGNCMFAKHCLGHCRAFAYAEYGRLDAPYPICQTLYDAGLFPQKYMIHPERDCSLRKRS